MGDTLATTVTTRHQFTGDRRLDRTLFIGWSTLSRLTVSKNDHDEKSIIKTQVIVITN